MSKRVLLVSYCFAPQNVIGAVRPTKLAKYLSRLGYQVRVLCGTGRDALTDPLLQRDLSELADVRVVRERSFLRWWKERDRVTTTPPALPMRAALPQQGLTEQAMQAQAERSARQATPPAAKGSATGGLRRRLQPLANAVYLWLTFCADAAFARACVRKLAGMEEHFDVVLSTYGPLSVHRVAYRARRWKLADRWIADFRDEVTVPLRWLAWLIPPYVRRVRRYADAITAASAGYLRVMGLEAFGQVIHNGFDPEDLQGLSFPQKRTDCFTLVHCGQMYGTRRDLSPLFQAIAELVAEGVIDPQRVMLAYAGRDTQSFAQQATRFGLQRCLRNWGNLPRDEALRLQKSAHGLLLAAWNAPRQQGNLPGKFLEYLMLEMPVICCVAGELADSEIARIMRETQAGLCYEQANAAADAPRLKAYVRALYEAFLRGEPMPYAPVREAVEGFACEGMAAAFAARIENA